MDSFPLCLGEMVIFYINLFGWVTMVLLHGFRGIYEIASSINGRLALCYVYLFCVSGSMAIITCDIKKSVDKIPVDLSLFVSLQTRASAALCSMASTSSMRLNLAITSYYKNSFSHGLCCKLKKSSCCRVHGHVIAMELQYLHLQYCVVTCLSL